jgi:hypothetical protein
VPGGATLARGAGVAVIDEDAPFHGPSAAASTASLGGVQRSGASIGGVQRSAASGGAAGTLMSGLMSGLRGRQNDNNSGGDAHARAPQTSNRGGPAAGFGRVSWAAGDQGGALAQRSTDSVSSLPPLLHSTSSSLSSVSPSSASASGFGRSVTSGDNTNTPVTGPFRADAHALRALPMLPMLDKLNAEPSALRPGRFGNGGLLAKLGFGKSGMDHTDLQ